MSRVEFDELLRQKIDSEELEVDPVHWDRLAALLPATADPLPVVTAKPRRILPWVAGIAASVAVLIAAAWLFMGERNSPPASRPALSEERQEPTLNIEEQRRADTDTTTPVKQSSKPGIYVPYNHNSIQGNNNITFNNDEVRQEVILHDELQKNIPEPPVAPKEEFVVKHNQTSFDNKENTADKENFTYKMPELIAGAAEGIENDTRTSIALGGGVNYGTMNTGYTMGLSARRYVSDKVFVDGSVAVMMNKNSQNTLNYTGDFIAEQKSMADNAYNGQAARPSSENYYYPAKGLYYIQFNPSIGYKVAKKVAMSVGGDFQQMLQNSANNETLMFDGGEDARLFPTFDVGVTGKTEINITPAIQAGVLYREGINNLIRNESRYVNRRYVQVQVKYSLPIR